MNEPQKFPASLRRAGALYAEHRDTLHYGAWAFLSAMTPLLLSLLLYALRGHGLNLFRTLPSFSDDFFYYSQVKAMLAYGKPLGHIGSYLHYAAVGSFGYWGVATLLPYAAFAFLFGLHYNTLAIANVLFVLGANLLFLWLVRMPKRSLGWFALANGLSFSTLLFFTSSSSMPLRYALALLLCGMLAHIYLFPTHVWFRRIVVPLVLIFAACCYAPFAVLTPCFFLAGAKKWRGFWKRLLLSLPFSAALAGGVLWMNDLIWAKYFLLNDTAADAYLAALKASPAHILSLSYQRMLTVLSSCEPLALLFGTARDSYAASPFRIFYFASFGALVALCVAMLYRYRKEKNTVVFHSFYLYAFLTLFVATIMLSQDDYLSTTYRFLTVPMCCVLALSAVCERKDLLKLFAVVCIFGLIPFLSAYQDSYPEYCYATTEVTQNLDRLSTEYAEVISVSPNADPWDNTIAIDCHDWRSTIALPAGLSMNLCTGGTESDNLAYDELSRQVPKYVMTCTETCAMCAYKGEASPLQNYLQMGYQIVYQDEWAQTVILERK